MGTIVLLGLALFANHLGHQVEEAVFIVGAILCARLGRLLDMAESVRDRMPAPQEPKR